MPTWHHLLRQVQEQESHFGGVEAHLFGRRVGQRPQLRHQLGARVGRADHYHGAPGGGHLRIVLDVGQLQLLDEVVAQVERLGGGLQPARMPREARDVEQPRHRPRREHQPVPGHGMAAFLGIAIRQRLLREVHPSTRPRTACTPRNELASGTATNRASTTPPATSGSNGVYSM